MNSKDMTKEQLIEEIEKLENKLALYEADPGEQPEITVRGYQVQIRKAHTMICEDSPDAIIIMREWKVIDCNQAALKLYKFDSKEEFIGKEPQDLSPKFQPGGIRSIDGVKYYIEKVKYSGPQTFDWLSTDSEGKEFMTRVRLAVADYNEKADYITCIVRNMTRRLEQEELISYFADLVDNSGDAIIGIGPDYLINIWNTGAEQIFKHKREDIVGQKIIELFPESDRRQLILFIDRAFKGDHLENFEIESRDNDGRQLFISISMAPVINTLGNVAGVSLIARDITRQKLSEAKLRASEQRFRMLVENAFDGIYLLHQKRYEYINPRFEEITGYSYHEVTDKDFDYEILLTDEGRETIQKRYEARLAGKDISPQYELKIRNKKGHFVNIEVTTVSIARPGDVYVLGIMRDISDRIKAEKALAQTNELFRIAFTTSPDAISISDLETGEYVDVNEGYAHLTGYSKDEIIGKGSLEINIWNNPADREKVVDILQKEGKIVNYQAEFRLKSGAVRHGLMSANLVEIDGRPHLLTITRDITDNVRAEKQLRQSEERFRLITNNMNDIVCLHAPHGEYVYISPSIEDVLGYLPMELIGTNPLDLVHPEDINDNLIAHYKEISRTSGKIRGEYRMKNKSGDYVWVESISQIIRRPDGEIDHLVSSTRDISDRIESERLLQYSEEQYRLLFEKILNGYVIYNILYDDEGEPYDYRFIKVNHAFEEITGLSAENVIGRTVLEVVPNLGDQWERVYYEIATHGDPIRTELYSPNFDRYYEIVGFMTREGQLAMVFSDISDRKEYEQRMESINKELEHRVAERTKQVEDTLLELENENEERRKAQEQLIRLNEELEKSRSALIEEANKLIEINQRLKDSEQTLKEANATKDKFFSIIAHDLKNPLQALILTANVLLKSHHMMDDDELDNKIFRVYHTSRIFGNLLDNLLQWARSQTGRIEFMPEIIDLEDVFSRNHSVVSQLAERKQIHISLRNIGSTNVFADFNLLNTILRNLLTNAIKFTNEKGRVLLLSRENVNGIEISVTDNGCGLDEETIKKLFGGMSHYTTPGTNDEKGTGLGLVLCREFVEMHGGELHVKSTLGEGSKFYFQLPKAHDK